MSNKKLVNKNKKKVNVEQKSREIRNIVQNIFLLKVKRGTKT